jgi:transcriptional regulator with XRE-family HTH domain
MSKTLRTKRHKALMAVLRATRVEAGLTQLQLSDKMGRANNYITKVETGERRLAFLDFLEIATHLGIDPQKLMERILRW